MAGWETTGDGWITAPTAARLLGLQLNTVYAMIDRGELPAEVRLPPGPKRRRSVRLRRQAVDDFLERARVRPGELSHMIPPPTGRYLPPRERGTGQPR